MGQRAVNNHVINQLSNLPLILSLFSTSTVLLPRLIIPRNPQFFSMNLAHSSPLLPLFPTSLCSLVISMFMSTLLLTHFPRPSLTYSHRSTLSNMSTFQFILRITPLTYSHHIYCISLFSYRYHALLSTSLIITSSWLTSKLNPLFDHPSNTLFSSNRLHRPSSLHQKYSRLPTHSQSSLFP